MGGTCSTAAIHTRMRAVQVGHTGAGGTEAQQVGRQEFQLANHRMPLLCCAVLCPSSPGPPARRFTDAAGRAGTARLLVGLGVAPGGRPCRELLERINGEPGFMAVDVSDMDLAQASFFDCIMCLGVLARVEQRQQISAVLLQALEGWAAALPCTAVDEVISPPSSQPLLPAGAPAAHGGRPGSAGWRGGAG